MVKYNFFSSVALCASSPSATEIYQMKTTTKTNKAELPPQISSSNHDYHNNHIDSDNHDNHDKHDNKDSQDSHDYHDQDNQVRLAHLYVDFRVILEFAKSRKNK